MTDYAHNPAGLDTVADHVEDLSEDSTKIEDYWTTYSLPLADQVGKGLPALALPKLQDLTPGVDKQSAAMEGHIATVSNALHDTAEMFRQVQAENIDKVKSIWGSVPQSENTRGRTSAGLKGLTVPSATTLNTAPQPAGMLLEDIVIQITQLARDIDAETIFFNWVDKLLGQIFGERPTQSLLEWLVGDWEALSTVSDVFHHFVTFTDLMQSMIIDAGKSIRTAGEWQGPSCEAAFESICGNANKLDGLRKIWQAAEDKFEAWATASYIMLNEAQANLAAVPALILRGKTIVTAAGRIMTIGADMVWNMAVEQAKLVALLKELMGVAVAILSIFKKVIGVLLISLQAFYVLVMTLTALFVGDTDLEKAW